MKKAAEALSFDVISSDITISRKIYQQRASTSRGNLDLAIAKRSVARYQQAATVYPVESFSVIFNQLRIPAVARYQQAATVYPVESFSVIFNQLRMLSKRCRLNKLIRHRLIYPVVGSPAASISLPPAGQPDASNSTSSLDMESSRKKADVKESYNPDARYPVAVFEASAVAQSIQSTKKQLCVKCCDKEKTTAERTAVEQSVGE
ncbi:UDP-glucuronate:xylan alpha-glucuronosyltransferase 1-like [Dorcoceras hygrometricum]|uniref:UDP-glucuronate:xylan alpha-glucuronosyltransferase 1-like n=1 Tax=Dorcoceras hygrometricum TaxID=472368 RepID=A0A2Z7C2F0_9LAMI|nr:UDP-glucuronate:xylan alpha-glucuronosyltransferase 1-like [Dorcoceras hygrometricum]